MNHLIKTNCPICRKIIKYDPSDNTVKRFCINCKNNNSYVNHLHDILESDMFGYQTIKFSERL